MLEYFDFEFQKELKNIDLVQVVEIRIRANKNVIIKCNNTEIKLNYKPTINDIENNSKIYDYIYKNVIKACVEAIKKGDYEFAYNRYKNSILTLEEEFARPKLTKRFIKILRKI